MLSVLDTPGRLGVRHRYCPRSAPHSKYSTTLKSVAYLCGQRKRPRSRLVVMNMTADDEFISAGSGQKVLQTLLDCRYAPHERALERLGQPRALRLAGDRLDGRDGHRQGPRLAAPQAQKGLLQ